MISLVFFMVTEILILRNEPSIATISRNKENKEAYCLNGNTNKEPMGFGIGKGQTISTYFGKIKSAMLWVWAVVKLTFQREPKFLLPIKKTKTFKSICFFSLNRLEVFSYLIKKGNARIATCARSDGTQRLKLLHIPLNIGLFSTAVYN